MKYLKNYNSHKNFNTLTNEEVKMVDYIFSVNENINEGLMDKLKEVAKKGALTTAMVTAMLSSNPSFAKEYKSLPSAEKHEIELMTKDSDSTGTFDISKAFNSGVYKLDDAGKQELSEKLTNLISEINASKVNKKYIIEIKASESKLRNKDIETGKPLPAGELAKRRAEEVHQYINAFLSNYTSVNLEVVKRAVIAGPEFTGQDKEVFKPYQNVTLNLLTKEISDNDFCGFDDEINKTQITNNIGLEKEFDVSNKFGSGDIIMNAGTIPDRLVLYADGVKIGDTGFFATGKNANIDNNWNYTPANILALTNLYNNKGTAIKDTQLIIRKVGTWQELLGLMLKDKSRADKDFTKTGQYDDVDMPIKELMKMFNNGQRDFVFYKKEAVKLPYDLKGKYKKIKMVVYSPRDKSSFNIKVTCSKVITKK